MFPKQISVTSQALVIRINSSPNSYHRQHQRNFAPECPVRSLPYHMESAPTRKPQTLCERFWGNLGGIWRGLEEDVGWIWLDELLILSVEAQWEDYVAALALRLGAEDEAFIDSLVAPGHASTHGYTDPLYPVTGRVPRSA